jgi:hypothetical protein
MLERQTIKSVALPAAGASASTAAIHFGTSDLGSACKIKLSLEALPSLVNTKKATVTLTECDTEGGSYTTLETVGNMAVTGPSSGGSAAKEWELYLPPVHKAYIKAAVAVESAGGDNTAKTLTMAVRI